MSKSQRKTIVFDSQKLLAEAALTAWKHLAVSSIKEKGFFSVALSGGKTPEFFYKVLQRLKPKTLWEKTHIFLVDERLVSFKSKDSNFRMIQTALLDNVSMLRQNIHPIITSGKTVGQAAKLYQKHLKSFFGLKPGSFPRFDLIILGIGEDGHTASLFPGKVNLQNRKDLVIPVSLSFLAHKRISISLRVINSAKNILFIVTGKRKTKVVKRVLAADKALPASRVRLRSGKVVFFIGSEVTKG